MTSVASLVIASSVFSSLASASVTIDWVTVGNPGNAAHSSGFGAVDHEYKIGKYEVTNTQYISFLNAKGQSNANGIYNTQMANYGITQSGSTGSFTYSVTGGLENRPVVYVSWFDAARFANWMTNGQGNSDTETGAYTLNGASSGIILANAGAQVYIPSENEWVKAAYYNAMSQNYSAYPNGQNTISTADANYSSSGSTNVGSYSGSPSSYGTYDQGGNVWEWNDGLPPGFSTHRRGTRGNGWIQFGNPAVDYLGITGILDGTDPIIENPAIGFRLASAVPEPSAMLITMLASAMMLIRRRR